MLKREENQKIVHVLPANVYHLSPNIIEIYLDCFSEFNSIFVCLGNPNIDWDRYTKLFSKYNHTDFFLCDNLRDFFKILWKYRKYAFLLHSDSIMWKIYLIILNCKNINWVCWGSGVDINNSVKSILSAIIKKIVYNRLQSIVVLLRDDIISLEKKFNFKNVHLIPYTKSESSARIYFDLFDKRLSIERKKNKKPIILLGNSFHRIKSYIELLKILSIYKGLIVVHCMLQYSVVKNKTYDFFKEMGESIFKEDFILDTKYHNSMDDYIDYMNIPDIYICGAKTQSGLGAISTSLLLGKKIYLTGKNYNWTIFRGCKIYDIKEINSTLDFKEFISELSSEEKKINTQILRSRVDGDRAAWREYLSGL